MSDKSYKSEDFIQDLSGSPMVFYSSFSEDEYVELVSTGEHVNSSSGELRPTPYINSRGKVIVDSQPIALPAGMKRPETLEETVNRILSHSMLANYYVGEESLEEADDFDVDDDVPDPVTRYEDNHGVATVMAADHGIVKAPSHEDLESARTTIRKAKDFVSRRRATPPPSGEVKGPKATETQPDAAPVS